MRSYAAAGISPHAPYSTSPAAISACVDLAIRHRRVLAMHVAESPAERELLAAGTGEFATALAKLGVWQAGLFPWPGNPVEDLIGMLSQAPRALLIHGNDLNSREIRLLAEQSQMTLVYCPRTHAFFGYGKHPVDQLLAAGVRVALGTDSRASNPDLDLWKEVQFLLKHRADLDPASVIAMATVHGADAWGRTDLGRIDRGCSARLGWVATDASNTDLLFASFAENAFHPLASEPTGR
jgi:cytosine/adenosine deaminase-related metal-dependent hydrolase